MTAALVPAMASAQVVPIRPACENAPESGFTDIPTSDSELQEAVDCIAAYEVTRGTSPTQFSPGDVINRGQMALFVYRKLQQVEGYTLPASPPNAFTDDNGTVWEPAINALAAAGIIDGYPDNTFRPTNKVTRGQTAKIVANQLDEAGLDLPASPPDAFADDDDSIFELHINQLADLGIVQGTATGVYGVDLGLTRGQMARILARDITVLVEAELVPPYDPDADRTEPTLVSSEPADGDTDVAADVTLVATFDEDLDSASAVIDCGEDGEEAPIEATIDGAVATVDPAEDLPAGADCEAVFTATDAAGNVGTATITFTVAAEPTTNQAFTVAPSEDLVLAEGDSQTFTVSDVDVANVDIALVDCDNVTRDGDMITFADADDDDVVDASTTTATITGVNNVSGGSTDDVVPVAGNVTFTVSAPSLTCAVAVVFDDADGDDVLDLDGDDVLVDAFSVTGDVTFLPGEATTGTLGADQTIVIVDEGNDTFLSATDLYQYQADDLFYIDANGDDDGDVAEQVTLTQFEAQLSAGDVLSAGTAYNATDSLQSTFLIDDVTPLAPSLTVIPAATTDTSVTLTVGNVAAGATVNVYCQVDADTGDDAVDDATDITTDDTSCATATTDADAATAGFQVVVSGLTAATTYDMAANQVVDGEASALSAELENVATEPTPGPDATITSATLTDAVVLGAIDSGDTWTLVFDQVMAAPAEGDQVWVTDSDGDVVRAECDTDDTLTGTGTTDATCALVDGPDADGDLDTITVTLDADPANIEVAGDEVFLYPATVAAVAGIETAAGGEVDVDGSGDTTVS